jgi:hypothetical protein
MMMTAKISHEFLIVSNPSGRLTLHAASIVNDSSVHYTEIENLLPEELAELAVVITEKLQDLGYEAMPSEYAATDTEAPGYQVIQAQESGKWLTRWALVDPTGKCFIGSIDFPGRELSEITPQDVSDAAGVLLYKSYGFDENFEGGTQLPEGAVVRLAEDF